MSPKRPKMILLGDAGVGKSAFLYRYLTGVFDDTSANCSVELHSCPIQVDNQKVTFNLWDTAGMESHRALNVQYYRNADVAILMFGVDKVKTFLYLDACYKEFREHVGKDAEVLLYVIGHKTDMDRQVTSRQGRNFAKDIDACYCECSSLTGAGVNEVFEKIGQEYLNQKNLKKTESSPQLYEEPDTFRLKRDPPKYEKNVTINCFSC